MRYIFFLVYLACSLAICPLVQAQNPNLNLTDTEKAYIQNRAPIKLVVDPDWYPYEAVDKKGTYHGIAADLLQLISSRTGLVFEVIPSKNWNESIRLAQEGKAEAISLLNATAERQNWLLFSEVYYSDPNVLITHKEHEYISDLSRFSHETMVLPSGTSIEERLRQDYPALKIIIVETEPQAIELVNKRQADMTLRSLGMAAYHINKGGYFNLKIAGEMPTYVNNFRIGITKQDTILRNILNKGIASITPQELQEIVNKHIAIKVQKGFDYQLFFLVGGIGLIIILVSLFWMRKLYKINQKLYLRQTELTTLSTQLAESEFFYKSILNAFPEGIIVTDSYEKIIMTAPATNDILQVDNQESVLDKNLRDFIVSEEHELLLNNIAKLKTGEKVPPTYYQLRTTGTTKHFIEVASELLKNPYDGSYKIISILRNATEKIHSEQYLQSNAAKYQELLSDLEEKNKLLSENITIDKMTGIKNRYFFEQRLNEDIKLATQMSTPLVLLLFDIDNFKKVNDTYGHDVGDKIIIRLTQKTSSTIRATDLFARWGGEEFVILMPNTHLNTAKERAEQLRQTLANINHPETGPVTVSIGVAEWLPNESADAWFKRTDIALYTAKRNGRNRVEVSSELEAVDSSSLSWSDSFCSGNTKIDKQHRELLELCLSIIKATVEDNSASNLHKIFISLTAHIKTHFESEEEILRAVNYPDLTKHCEIHQNLINKLDKILKNAPVTEALSKTVVAFIINDVVMEHLLKEDTKFFHLF